MTLRTIAQKLGIKGLEYINRRKTMPIIHHLDAMFYEYNGRTYPYRDEDEKTIALMLAIGDYLNIDTKQQLPQNVVLDLIKAIMMGRL